jgi:hypothetical protein
VASKIKQEDNLMFKSFVFGAMAAALILALGSTTAVAQDNIFALSYFSNAHTQYAPDGALRLVNDGTVSDASPAGDLCASVYVFDSAEQMNECCSCRITPNGILSLSVNTDLTSNTLTGKIPTRGVIKVVSSKPSGGTCDAKVVAPQIGIRGWITHVQLASHGYVLTEEELIDSTYGSSESADLAEDCTVLTELGSGAGICSCTDSLQ